LAKLEEKCQHCGKIITRRAIAHVYGDLILCTACCRAAHAIEAAKHEREREFAEVESEPATVRQLVFAKTLGLNEIYGESKWDMSRRITERLDQMHGEGGGLDGGLEAPTTIRYIRLPAEKPQAAKWLLIGGVVLAAILIIYVCAGAGGTR
jgi:hypothetical protein